MKKLLTVAVCILAVCFCASAENSILIKGGTVYDGGTGEPYKADVLIKGNTISKIGKCSAKKVDKVIDATGMVVCPGFIDPHSHVNANMVKEQYKHNKGYLCMGVTTVLCGVCGGGPVPISKQADKLQEQGFGTNIGYFLGLGSVRKKVIGNADRVPTAEELEKMKKMVKTAMEWGAFGVSSGLIYTPGCFAKTDELIELTKVAAPYGGIYTTHMRNEGNNVLQSLDEALKIGNEAGVAVNISHMKCTTKMKGHSDLMMAKMDSARRAGMRLTGDQYPFTASSTSLTASVLPKWASAAGRKGYLRMFKNEDTLAMIKKTVKSKIGPSKGTNMLFSNYCKDEAIRGLTLAEIAEKWNMDATDAAIEVLRRSAPSVVKFIIDEGDLRNIMKQPWTMTGTDGSVGGHPRSFSTYTLKIRKFVLEEKIITLDEMIRRSTGMVAETYGIPKRGFIREGYYADVLVFNPYDLKDNADYKNPRELSTGFKAVIVNGEVAVDESRPTEALAGMIVKMDNSYKK